MRSVENIADDLGANVLLTLTHHGLTLLSRSRGNTVANRPRTRASDIKGDFAHFTEFMRRLVAVPHSKVKALP